MLDIEEMCELPQRWWNIAILWFLYKLLNLLLSADVSDVDDEGRVNLQENLFYHDGNLVNNHLRLDRTTLTKKCGIFRQSLKVGWPWLQIPIYISKVIWYWMKLQVGGSCFIVLYTIMNLHWSQTKVECPEKAVWYPHSEEHQSKEMPRWRT